MRRSQETDRKDTETILTGPIAAKISNSKDSLKLLSQHSLRIFAKPFKVIHHQEIIRSA